MRRVALIALAAALPVGGMLAKASPDISRLVGRASPPPATQPTGATSCDPGRLALAPAGSDFSLSSLGSLNETGNLRDEQVKPPFVEILEAPEKVKGQLRSIYASGQRKISTILWHAPLIGPDTASSRSGYLLNSRGGLHAAILKGLETYYRAVRDTGFTEVVVRFGLQGCAQPSNWRPGNPIRCPESYSSQTENDNFAVVAQTHRVLDRVFEGTPVKRWFDLAVEASGWPDPHAAYNARLWQRYIDAYGAGDSYGFSIAYQPGRLAEIYRAYDRAGTRPPMIAVDIYDHHASGAPMEIALRKLAKEMREMGLSQVPVVIQETFYNHKPSYQAIVRNAQRFSLNLHAIYQWGIDTRHHWVATPVRYEAYCPSLVDQPSAVAAN